MNKTRSEFGKGLAYCLALFLAHERDLNKWLEFHERIRKDQDKEAKRLEMFTDQRAVEMFFNAAADHFFDFMPELAPKGIKRKCAVLKDKCLGWRCVLSFTKTKPATEKDARWAIKEAKYLLYRIDKSNGIPAIQATWK